MRWILLIILTTQAATCGQKGPLTLPQSSGWSITITGAVTGTVDASGQSYLRP